MHQNIILDSSIFLWVLLPLVLITLCLGAIRQFVGAALRTSTTIKKLTAKQVHAQTISFANLLQANGNVLSPETHHKAFEKVKMDLSAKVDGMQMDQLLEGGAMNDMMKNNMLHMVPNLGMMTLVSYFFSGFVIAKFPFAVSSRFKPMVQRGVDIDSLDGNYVTSLSLYFLIMFGAQGVQRMIFGSEGAEEQNRQNSMMMGGGQTASQPVDYSKVFPAMKEELQFAADQYQWALLESPRKLLISQQTGLLK